MIAHNISRFSIVSLLVWFGLTFVYRYLFFSAPFFDAAFFLQPAKDISLTLGLFDLIPLFNVPDNLRSFVIWHIYEFFFLGFLVFVLSVRVNYFHLFFFLANPFFWFLFFSVFSFDWFIIFSTIFFLKYNLSSSVRKRSFWLFCGLVVLALVKLIVLIQILLFFLIRSVSRKNDWKLSIIFCLVVLLFLFYLDFKLDLFYSVGQKLQIIVCIVWTGIFVTNPRSYFLGILPFAVGMLTLGDDRLVGMAHQSNIFFIVAATIQGLKSCSRVTRSQLSIAVLLIFLHAPAVGGRLFLNSSAENFSASKALNFDDIRSVKVLSHRVFSDYSDTAVFLQNQMFGVIIRNSKVPIGNVRPLLEDVCTYPNNVVLVNTKLGCSFLDGGVNGGCSAYDVGRLFGSEMLLIDSEGSWNAFSCN